MSRSALFTITALIFLWAIVAIQGADNGVPMAIAPFDAQSATHLQQQTAIYLDEPVLRTIDLGDDVKIELLLIPAGEFDMGSPFSEWPREYDEDPVRRIKISRPFYIGRYEVTQAQWKAVMGYTSCHFKGPDLPADGIPWKDAVAFCKRLGEKQSQTFRLPTEAEWEYACRAGTTTAYSFGNDRSVLDDYAWFNSNSDHKTHPVGRKMPNAFGLHDVHGNVWEWCSDWFDGYRDDQSVDPTGPQTGFSRILRGGSWFCTPGPCRSANRGYNTPNIRDDDVGFRIVMDCPE
jgi:formylglycine-generating enzyme required for sulfatase activity